jgi:hypothetical protein
MSHSPIRSIALVAAMTALAAFGSGCYAEAEAPVYAPGQSADYPQGAEPVPQGAELQEPPAVQAPEAPQVQPQEPPATYQPQVAPATYQPQVVQPDYQPQYYGDYVVYYDVGGRPYYYYGGSPYYVPYTSPFYAGYVRHYGYYGPAYRHWWARGGYRYPAVRGGGYRTGGYRGGYHGGYHGGTRGGFRGGARGGHHR